jgi:ABC-2 type transport system permease protein
MVREFIGEVNALVWRELRKFFGNPWIMVMMIIQPLLWIGLFGKAFNLTGLFTIPPEVLNNLPPYVTQQVSALFNQMMARLFGSSSIDYFSFMATGMFAVMAFFAGMSGGMSLTWDRRTGYLNKLLVAPIRRESIVLSKMISASIRSLVQALLLLLIAIPLGLKLSPAGIGPVLLSIAALFLLGLSMSALMLMITIRTRRHETQIMAMNLINLPLMFASNVLYPKSIMPSWLQAIASVNPLTYTANILRGSLLMGSSASMSSLLSDFTILLGISIVFLGVGIAVSIVGLREK